MSADLAAVISKVTIELFAQGCTGGAPFNASENGIRKRAKSNAQYRLGTGKGGRSTACCSADGANGSADLRSGK